MKQTNAYTIKEAYLENIRKVLAYGKPVTDERGNETLEILNLQTNIESKLVSRPAPYLKGSIWNGKKLDSYCKQILNPKDKGFVYDYGNRLRGFDIDQIDYIIEKLQENPNSRRAIAVTWRPNIDADSSEVPCLVMLDFKLRNSNLSTTAIWRSHDIFGAFYANLEGIKHISNYIANQLNADANIYNIHSLSAHILRTDFEASKNILQTNNIIPPMGSIS